MCSDGVLVDVDLDRLDSHLLRSVAEAAPGEVVPLPPGVTSMCLKALQSPNSPLCCDIVDLIRAAIELDCDASVHVDKIRRRMETTRMTPLADLDPHRGTHDELRRWFDTFAAAPPLYFAYTHMGEIRTRLRNLCSHCRSPSGDVVDSAVDFFRRMGPCPASDPHGASEMAFLARALAGSEAVRGREVALARCLVEHVRAVKPAGFLAAMQNFWEVLCEACLASSRPADAMAIADMCPPNMGFKGLVRSLFRPDLLSPELTKSPGPCAFIERLYASSRSEETRDMIWKCAIDSHSRDVVAWAMAFTGNQLTLLSLKPRKSHPNIQLLFDVAIRDDRCADADAANLLLEFKTLLNIETVQLKNVASLLERQGALASGLLVALATRSKPSASTSLVIEHLAASPGLRRESDGWFEAIAYFAKRHDVVAIERLLLMGGEPPRPPSLGGSPPSPPSPDAPKLI
jgi:hypothetical protein